MTRVEVRPTLAGFRWRLLSKNNRTIAISPVSSNDRRECIGHLQDMWLAAKERAPKLVREDNNRWSWVLLDRWGEPVARSASSYPRRIDCVSAIDRFIEATGAFDEIPVEAVTSVPRRRRGAGRPPAGGGVAV